MDLSNLMKEAQKMQERMQKAQQELSDLEEEGSAGSGTRTVTIRMNGRYEVLSLKINPILLDSDDAEMLQDLIIAAIRDVVRKIEKRSKSKISELTAGLNIPKELLKDSDNG